MRPSASFAAWLMPKDLSSRASTPVAASAALHVTQGAASPNSRRRIVDPERKLGKSRSSP